MIEVNYGGVVTTEMKKQGSICDDFRFSLAARKHVRMC